MRLGQEGGTRAEVVAADLGWGDRLSRRDVGVANDGQRVAERFQRVESGWPEIEVLSFGRGRPQVAGRTVLRTTGSSVHIFDADQPRRIV